MSKRHNFIIYLFIVVKKKSLFAFVTTAHTLLGPLNASVPHDRKGEMDDGSMGLIPLFYRDIPA